MLTLEHALRNTLTAEKSSPKPRPSSNILRRIARDRDFIRHDSVCQSDNVDDIALGWDDSF